MIRIPPPLLRQITLAAEAAYPEECCGLLAGRDHGGGSGGGSGGGGVTVTRAVASDNVAAGPNERFEVDPKVRFDLMRDIGDGPERIVGHYHSHPDHPASPSERDLDRAFESGLVWLIIAVENGVAADTQAWRLDGKTKTTHKIEIDPSEEA